MQGGGQRRRRRDPVDGPEPPRGPGDEGARLGPIVDAVEGRQIGVRDDRGVQIGVEPVDARAAVVVQRDRASGRRVVERQCTSRIAGEDIGEARAAGQRDGRTIAVELRLGDRRAHRSRGHPVEGDAVFERRHRRIAAAPEHLVVGDAHRGAGLQGHLLCSGRTHGDDTLTGHQRVGAHHRGRGVQRARVEERRFLLRRRHHRRIGVQRHLAELLHQQRRRGDGDGEEERGEEDQTGAEQVACGESAGPGRRHSGEPSG